MNSITFALLLLTGLQGCALTLDSDGLNNGLDAVMIAGSPCDDCTKIINLLGDLFSNTDLQKKITKGIGNLCDHLPGKASMAEFCKEEVDKIVPVVISLISVVAKPGDICKIMGLCGSNEQQKTLSILINEVLQLAKGQENEKPTSPCSFCIFFIKTLDDLLPKERTEEAVVQALEVVCQILPVSYRDQCEVIVGRFSKTLIDALMSYATPKAICTLIRLCPSQEGPPVDPCTLEAYRCRDLQTSLKCGTLFYCQRFAWKPLSDKRR
ncbi:prosaposin isoform X2 [Corythoichthys intestinalis]|nr:prosaposin isoform X2 [Corythoichthys intestinalis]